MNDLAGLRPKLEEPEFERLAAFIQGSAGIKMPPHKRGLLELRLGKRVRALGLGSFREYCEHVFDSADSTGELTELIDAVTTNKTDFFREAEHFEHLVDHVLPELIDTYPELANGSELRVWSAGCSSGEEPYTLAMVLAQFAETDHTGLRFKITASDLCSAMLRAAKQAVYPKERVQAVPDQLARKHLLRGKGRCEGLVRVAPHIRETVDLCKLNLMEEFPFKGTFDIIFCRNVLIYFERDVQVDILRRMCDQLVDGGYLFVGHSETLHGMGLPIRHVRPTVYRREQPL